MGRGKERREREGDGKGWRGREGKSEEGGEATEMGRERDAPASDILRGPPVRGRLDT